MAELIEESATRVVAMLKSGEIGIGDTLDALEARIAAVDGEINALPTLCFDRARAAAEQVDRDSILAGIPVAIKDLDDVAGVRTTSGSLVYADRVPETSNTLVECIEQNGGVVYAKSNTPEFGSGAQTFNEVFGATRNPWDLNLTPGGSSGGAAAALASGTAWLAQGSDLGGSLRTPASFCGVCSLRPSPGLITSGPSDEPFDVYAQKGPMARDVTDLALFADAMTNASEPGGLSKSVAIDEFRRAAAKPLKPLRIACSEDLGIADTHADVRAVFNRAMATLEAEGMNIEAAHPDLSMADAAFDAPRALGYALGYGGELDRIRDLIKPENVWNIEYGLQLSNAEILDSMAAQGQIFNNAANFMRHYDLLICPVAIVPPYSVEERYVGESEGLDPSQYYRWLRLAYAITSTTLPVITVPCGKTDSGLPIGIQLIGKPHGETALFGYARFIEQVFGWDTTQLIRS